MNNDNITQYLLLTFNFVKFIINEPTIVLNNNYNLLFKNNISLNNELVESCISIIKKEESNKKTLDSNQFIYFPLYFNNNKVGAILTLYEEVKDNKNIRSNLLKSLTCLTKFVQTTMFNSKRLEKNRIMIVSKDGTVIVTNSNKDLLYTNKDEVLECSTYNYIFSNYIEQIISLINSENNKYSNTHKEPFKNIECNKKEINKITLLFNSNNNLAGLICFTDSILNILGSSNVHIKAKQNISFSSILGKSQIIKSVINKAKKIAQSESTILLTGESGTGKELFARSIHFESSRKEQPFVAINCAAIPDNLLESELFGYMEGAFTGALKTGKIGKFEKANNGTLFLDEIGDMQLNLQAKLLRVIQDKTIERIGGVKPIPINIRIISATNKELHKKVEVGEFREDLFYRLSVVPLRIPALKDRRSDILYLSNAFLLEYSVVFGTGIKFLSKEVESLFLKYIWPGNIRELRNVIEYSVVMSDSEKITIDNLPIRFTDRHHREKNLFLDTNDKTKIRKLSELEKAEILKAIELFGYDKTGIKKVTKALGISRSTLYRRLKEYNINIIK